METTYIDLDKGIFTDPTDGQDYPCEILCVDTPSVYRHYYTLYIKYMDPDYIPGTLLNIDSQDKIDDICRRHNLHLAPVNTNFPYFTDKTDALEFCEILEIMLQEKFNRHFVVDSEPAGKVDSEPAGKIESKSQRLAGHVQLEFE